MDARVVPSSPRGGKAGSQPKDLGVTKLVQTQEYGSTWGRTGTPTVARGRKKQGWGKDEVSGLWVPAAAGH